MDGWIKLHRQFCEKAFYRKDSQKVHLWIHLLLKASHPAREELLGGKPIICQPGEFTTGRKQLFLETGICESKIERILSNFEKIEQQIEQQKTSTNRLISIVNWVSFQKSEQQSEQQVNNDRTTSEQQVNTLLEYKEYKNTKNKKEINKEKKVASEDAISVREKIFYDSLKNSLNDYSKILIREFFDYWSEKNKSKTKMRFELQKTWDLNLRLKTWRKRSEKYAEKTKMEKGASTAPSASERKQTISDQLYDAIRAADGDRSD